MKKAYTHDNTQVVNHLEGYFKYGDAVTEYPVLDDIVTAVCNLDYGGNDRPLSKSTIFMLLSNLPCLTVKNIKEVMDNSTGHASKLFTALRIASRAFEQYMDSLDRQSAEYQERLKLANVELNMHALFTSLRSDREITVNAGLRCRRQRRRAAKAHSKKSLGRHRANAA